MLSILIVGAVMVTPGLSTSSNYGEGNGLNPALRVGITSKHVETFGQWDGANKTESGRGFILGGEVLLRHKSFVGGVSYRYRDGGSWVKQSLWARVGLEHGPYRILYGHDLNSVNRVRMVTLSIRCQLGHVIVEPQVSAASYLQSGRRQTGLVAGLWFGVVTQERRER